MSRWLMFVTSITILTTVYSAPGYKHRETRSPAGNGPPDNRGPPHNRGPPDNRGPPNNRGPPGNRGPPDNRGPPSNRGPPNNRGPPDNRGPPGHRGPPDNKEPQGNQKILDSKTEGELNTEQAKDVKSENTGNILVDSELLQKIYGSLNRFADDTTTNKQTVTEKPTTEVPPHIFQAVAVTPEA